MCYGEAFHGPGVQGVKGLILVGALFLPSVAPVSQGGFGVMELRLPASIPSLVAILDLYACFHVLCVGFLSESSVVVVW
jgi:hypothetical protein